MLRIENNGIFIACIEGARMADYFGMTSLALGRTCRRRIFERIYRWSKDGLQRRNAFESRAPSASFCPLCCKHPVSYPSGQWVPPSLERYPGVRTANFAIPGRIGRGDGRYLLKTQRLQLIGHDYSKLRDKSICIN